MAAPVILVRPRAWWYSKVPLSIVLLLMLVDGQRCTPRVVAVLVLVPLTVSAAANYGYAVNELFDIIEDGAIGRANAAAVHGRRRVALIAAGSALAAAAVAFLAAGGAGALLTALELCLPLAYSVAPIRLKERGWSGAVADGLAAHVYPAALALLALADWKVRTAAPGLVVCVIAWAAACGLRGILSHLLRSAEADRRAGLDTVAHRLGLGRLQTFTIGVVLPAEAVAFGGMLIQSATGALIWGGLGLYLAYELFKTVSGAFRTTVLRPEGQPYVPLVEESFYKAWGPLILAADAARHDPRYVMLGVLYGLGFHLHMVIEWRRLRAVRAALRSRGPAFRSSAGR